nr:hypothetical protein [Tanacetum cinerariifolium]
MTNVVSAPPMNPPNTRDGSSVWWIHEIFPIVNQVDARVQNLKYNSLKEAAKFVGDEADESLARHKALEYEIERLLRGVVSQDIMSVVQNNSVIDTG